ncbi:MAG TPA: HAMP domain-containing sensor histidine kinase, partial [Gemmatimonadaceae bacterium]|nr:HAMP domain-containing sensor histidine kinase [Gemmatimonadaceae bacterium]
TIRNAQQSGVPLTSAELDRRPGYFLMLDSLGRLLYSSSAVRLLAPEDQSELYTVAFQLRPGGAAARLPLARDSLIKGRLMLVARRDPSVGPNISRVVGGLPTDLANVAPHLLLGTLLALAPVILVVSLGVAYFVAGRTFRPVDELINEVEAITDGRSLHRRLPVTTSGDELSRLSATLNAMISRLESSFTALRRFTADASHELKTPLTVLRADVERAMHPGTSPADRMVALEEALQETARMADLVESLLTLARADEGRYDLHREPVRLEPIVRDVFETAAILGEEAGLTIELPVCEDATVLGDPDRLRQLLLNLATNAIKYTPRGGHVEISLTHRPHDEVAVGVRDTGIGISASDLPHVFERFWRADRVRSRRIVSVDNPWSLDRGGFGLGLSIAQWIVQAHGGTLTVQSRLGRGSMFSVVLPVVPGPREDTDERAEAPAMSASREPSGKGDSNSDFTDS